MRSVRISDLLDGIEAPDLDLDGPRAVSPERIKEIAMKKIHSEQTKKSPRFKRPAVAALAAALALALGVTVFAAAQGTFFNNAFGTGVAGQEAFNVDLTDADGNVVKTEHFPTIERVEVDEDKAEALVGAYVSAVGRSVTLENYTFTVEEALLDENGVGALTLHVENPNGHGLKQSGVYDGIAGEYAPFLYVIEGESGAFMDDRDYPVTESFTETEATYVIYVTPFDPLPADEALTLTLRLQSEADYEDWPKAEITIPASDKIPARAFAAEGVTASVSPVGMTMTYDFGPGREKIESDVVIRYADGSEYVVKGDGLINMSVSSLGHDRSMTWIAFNRLADPDNITGIRLTGHWYGEDDTVHPYDLTLTSA